MARKIILLKGLPASGKSSWARSTLSSFPGEYKRVNKDELRAMLDASEWSPENEDFVLKIRDYVTIEGLRAGKSVLVDDTNLDPKHEARMQEIASQMGVQLEVKSFEVGVDQCIKNDQKRDRPIGSKAIFAMHKKYVEPQMEKIVQNPSLPMAIMCDIDGTLADKGTRNPFDWSKVGEDKIIAPVEDLLFQYQRSSEIILLSGRDSICRQATEDWLADHGVAYSKLFMRAKGDNRPDWLVKKELFDEHIKDKYFVLFCLDDRNQVVRLWRNMGLTCFQVNDGFF